LDAGLVVRSVGYRVDPPEPLVLADGDNRVAHSDGRAHDSAGNPIPGRYVAGWLKRGPSGIIGTNKGDAAATVATLLDDADSDVLSRGSAGIDTVVHEKVVDYRRWLAIDAQEIADGQAQGRGRRKLHSWPSLLGAAGHD
jgi:ferredoxin--NADP+ reductase